MVRKPYPPGQKRKRAGRGLSEFGKELQEKQKLKNLYGLKERQFKNYVKEVLQKRGWVEDASAVLIKKLESRFDNIVFRLGLTASRNQARQMISHGFFLVNGKPVDIPSAQLKKGDKITIRPQKAKKAIFKNLLLVSKKYQPPSWLKIKKPTTSPEKIEGEMVEEPSVEEAGLSVEVASIFEFYSR